MNLTGLGIYCQAEGGSGEVWQAKAQPGIPQDTGQHNRPLLPNGRRGSRDRVTQSHNGIRSEYKGQYPIAPVTTQKSPRTDKEFPKTPVNNPSTLAPNSTSPHETRSIRSTWPTFLITFVYFSTLTVLCRPRRSVNQLFNPIRHQDPHDPYDRDGQDHPPNSRQVAPGQNGEDDCHRVETHTL